MSKGTVTNILTLIKLMCICLFSQCAVQQLVTHILTYRRIPCACCIRCIIDCIFLLSPIISDHPLLHELLLE